MDEQTKRFTVIENLKKELFANISEFMIKVQETPMLLTATATKAKSHFKGNFTDSSTFPYDDIIHLVLHFMPSSGRAWKVSTDFTLEAIKSGEFVEIDPISKTRRFSLVHLALLRLLDEIKRFKNAADQADKMENIFREKYVHQIRAKEPMITVENSELLYTFANYNSQMNIINLSKAIIESLEGNSASLDSLNLLSSSPIEEEKKQIAKEEISEKDIRNFFGIKNI